MFHWPTYLDLARELAQRAEQAALRAVLSRAYYAAFGVACDYLGDRKVIYRGKRALGSHEQRWEVFRDTPSEAPQALRSRLLKRAYELKKCRMDADYDKSVIIGANKAQQALEIAAELIELISKLPPLSASP
jgi:uncharacterized protein (UPF0332 family)